jgi:hypothetical protein
MTRQGHAFQRRGRSEAAMSLNQDTGKALEFGDAALSCSSAGLADTRPPSARWHDGAMLSAPHERESPADTR